MSGTKRKKAYLVIKDILDRTIAFLGLAVVSIPLAFTALLIFFESPQAPPFIKQPRVGGKGKIFYMYKLRTMKTGNVVFDVDNPVIEKNNNNLIKCGATIRKLKIDEFPQLINVLKGDMSLVGPRPLLPDYLAHYELWEMRKFNIKPGMTGLAQIKGNGYLSTRERSYYDIYYSAHVSFRLDVEIMFKTPLILLCGEKKFLEHVPEEKLNEAKAMPQNDFAQNKNNNRI